MRKTNFRKATLSALLMLVVAVVSLTGVTYAWFTTGKAATVKGIELGVKGEAGGLLIATDDFDFKSTIDFSRAKGAELVEYVPVSTNAEALKTGTFFVAEVGDTAREIKNLRKLSDSEKATGFFKQTIYVDNFGGQEKGVELSGNVLVDSKDASAALATRIAIVIEGTQDEPKYDGTDKFGGEQTVYIYEPNATTHTTAGTNEAKLDPSADPDKDGVYAYAGIKAAYDVKSISKYYDATEGTGNSQWLTPVNTRLLPGTAPAENTEANEIVIAGDTLTKINIYVWIEGQDHDCHNDIAGVEINASLTFTITR